MLTRHSVALLGMLMASPAAATAQLATPGTGGLAAIDREVRFLGPAMRVLVIGAHPDDEDTELLTILTRGRGAEAAYLSLNRGEGGQNLIGPELGEDLGLLRTEELMGARELDGSRQFFTRAYDFGYTRSLEETWKHWDHDSLLADVIRVIRTFHPQIIVSVFSGTPRDGHGQHQAAGRLARSAFELAGDPDAFPDAGAPWTPMKLYRSARFDTAAATLTLPGGELDPGVGLSFHQIAMRSRSLHRSQDMGRLQEIGPSVVRLSLLENRTGSPDTALFAGIDMSLHGSEGSGGQEAGAAVRFLARADSARFMVGPRDLEELAGLLARARDDLVSLSADQPSIEVADQLRHLDRAAFAARGIVVDATAPVELMVPGEEYPVELSAWNAGTNPVKVGISLISPDSSAGLVLAPDEGECFLLEPGEVRRREVQVGVPPGALATSPAYLEAPRDGEMYSGPVAIAPRDPVLLQGVFRGCGDLAGEIRREVVYRTNDQSRGEVRRPLRIVPRVEVALRPPVETWSTNAQAPHRFTVTLTRHGDDRITGRIGLDLPEGWAPVEPRPFELNVDGESESFGFEISAPAGQRAARLTIGAWAVDSAGRRFEAGVRTIDYPHIRTRNNLVPAVAEVNLAEISLPSLDLIGYVRGAADRVPEVLARAGLPVEIMDGEDLERGDLSRFDVIIVGPRAYETDTALVENTPRLLSWVHDGGLMIVQYQQYGFFRNNYAPYPLSVGMPHDRITDQTARVQVLPGGKEVMAWPNRITAADWQGWVQERGLYFARTWDDAWVPALRMQDPGQPPLDGGLLIAPYGEGSYVYTGISFFRELPAGVTGAMRLFANILAIGSPRPGER